MIFALGAAITWVWAWLGGVVGVIIITLHLVGAMAPLVATTMLRRTLLLGDVAESITIVY